jgi:hypothetical protein
MALIGLALCERARSRGDKAHAGTAVARASKTFAIRQIVGDAATGKEARWSLL